ncbi:MAG TPA: acyl-CoA desaturase [Phycisphaerales bacterium]|nr:acyl-CoA desaturase [Phycisphaerales bacterium]
MFGVLGGWFDASSPREGEPGEESIGEGPEWPRLIPFIGMHMACAGVIWVGWSWTAVSVAAALYVVRMFAITGFYHRYFSHRTFKTSRPVQFVFALVGNSAAQRGPLWWAGHHREHHRTSDTEDDIHSPHTHGVLWSHMGWFMSRRAFVTNLKAVPDLARYPELRWLDRFDIAAPIGLAILLYLAGKGLEAWAPGLGTSGWQMVVWGFFISTVVLYHATYTINSLSHMWGTRRFATSDDSRNNLWLALVTMGEGWHNNHHFNPGSVRQGFYWWEIDITFYGLWVLSKLGIVWDLRKVPARVYRQAGAGQRGPGGVDPDRLSAREHSSEA